MLKYAFLAGSMMIATPALAQDIPASPQQSPATQSAPATIDPAAPATTQDSAQAPVQDSAAAPAQDVAAAQPASGAQVADAVTTDFAKYDANGNGSLSATEFGAWMVALKSASDPSTKAASKETKTWLAQAFAQADKDKSKSVSETELTGFLKG